MTTERANTIDLILSDLEELYWVELDEKSDLVSWLNGGSLELCQQLRNALLSTVEEMGQLNADYSKLSALMYEVSVPYTDDMLSEHYADKRLDRLNSILRSLGFEGDVIC